MKKLVVEIDDDQLKKDFDVKCAKTGFSKKHIIAILIKKWLSEK